jgi:hypothetical protein
MKISLFFICVIALLTTTGCISSDAEWHGHVGEHQRYGGRPDAGVGPKDVELVRPPEVIVRPPDFIAP